MHSGPVEDELGWKSLGVLELTALPSMGSDRWVQWVRETDALLVNAWQFDPLTMVTNGGTVKAATGPLTASGTAFDVTWAHS